MKLDRTTYEAWLLDRIEGNLSPEQERQLDAFLAANPDLSGDLSGLPTLDPSDPAPIDWKNELKKRIPPTGVPDRTNLNEFLVARAEGDLDPASALALDKFLYEHPECEQDVRRMAASKVVPDDVAFQDKNTVQRHFPPLGLPDRHRLTDFLIAALEGDLAPEQRIALDKYLLVHPEARREARLVAAARVEAEPVVFADKDRLRKKEGRVIALWQRYAAAASVTLLIGLAWWMARNNQADQVARNEPPSAVNTPSTDGTNEVRSPEAGTEPMPDGTTGRSAGVVVAHPDEATGPNVTRGREPHGTAPSNATEQVIPIPETELEEAPAPRPEPPAADPLLAQQNDPETEEQVAEQRAPVAEGTFVAAGRPQVGGTPVGTVLANAVRDQVIDTDARNASLDGDDALAAVNKGLGAITGGQGRVEVQRKGGRDRWKFRLGSNFAISASTGR